MRGNGMKSKAKTREKIVNKKFKRTRREKSSMKISPDVDECFIFRLNLCRFSHLFGSKNRSPSQFSAFLSFPPLIRLYYQASLSLPPKTLVSVAAGWAPAAAAVCVLSCGSHSSSWFGLDKSQNHRESILMRIQVLSIPHQIHFLCRLHPPSFLLSSCLLGFLCFFSSCRSSQQSRDFAAAFVSRVMTAHSQRYEAAQRIAS